MITKKRKELKKPIDKFAKILGKISKNPNHYTYFSILFSIIGCFFLINEQFLVSFALFSLAFFLDALDGSIAKIFNKKTKWGNYLDAISDRIVEIFGFLGTLKFFPFLSYGAMTLSLLISYAKARTGLVIKMGNEDWSSLGERAERGLLFLFGILSASIYGKQALFYFLVLINIVCIIGLFQRVLFAKKLIQKV